MGVGAEVNLDHRWATLEDDKQAKDWVKLGGIKFKMTPSPPLPRSPSPIWGRVISECYGFSPVWMMIGLKTNEEER